VNASKSIVPFGNWFDRVRVRTTSATEEAGLAGRTGQVYGETRPSSSSVARDEIIGELTEDYAVNVHFDDLKKSVWLTRDLLEFVDHAPGTQIAAGGITKVRIATGEWIETSAKSEPEQALNPKRRRIEVVVWIVVAIVFVIILASVVKWLGWS
jgi:hypothetical protein